jgi:predicted MFS family arabinose efflux permease
MMAGRLAEALGYAVFSVVGPLLVTEASNARDRPLATGLFATWIPVGQLLAASVATPTLPQGDWQSLWWLALACIAAMAFWAWRLTPHLRAGWHKTSEANPGPATHTGAPRNQKASAWLAAALFGLWSGQYIAYMTWLPQFLNEDWNLGMRQIALSYAIVPIAVIAFNVVAGWLMRAGVPLMSILVPALLVQTAIWLLMPFIDSALLGIATLFLYGLVSGLIPACLFSLPALISRGSVGRTQTFGVMLSGRNLGALVGPVLLPAILLLSADNWSPVPWVFAIWMSVAVAVAILLAKCIRH